MPKEKVFTLDVLIERLQNIKKELDDDNKGNPLVLLSSDEEGNSYGTLWDGSFCYEPELNAVILFPADSILPEDYNGLTQQQLSE